jgi:hypothetical protein
MLRTLWIQNHTVSYRIAFGISSSPLRSGNYRENLFYPQAMPEARLFFYCHWLRERKSREMFLTEIILLACPSPRFLEYPAGKSRSSFRPWRLRSSDISCCYEFQPTYHESNWVMLTYAQRPRLVWPSVRVLGKPSLKRGRAGSASDWQDGEECVRKHLKSSLERYEKALATKKLIVASRQSKRPNKSWKTQQSLGC